MRTLLLTLHVVAAIFIIGPMAILPMSGLRAIRNHDAKNTKTAAKSATLYGLLSILVFVLGAGILGFSNETTFSTPWIIISMTLYIIALILTLALTAPALKKASTLLGEAKPVEQSTALDVTADDDVQVTQRTSQLHNQAQVDSARGRVAASSGVASLLLIVIAVLMVTQPFGS